MFLIVLCLLTTPIAQARWQDDLIRYMTQLPPQAPLRHADHAGEALKRSPLMREAAERELRASRKLAAGADDAARAAAVRQSLQTMLRNNPSLLRQIDQLGDADRAAALVMANGGRQLTETVGDLATRARLLETGGENLVLAVGLMGPDMARISLGLDTAIRVGKVTAPTARQWDDIARVAGRTPQRGHQAFQLADFTDAIVKGGKASKVFFEKYIKPHWQLWLGGSAITAYSLNPEFFQDQTGALTEAGFKHLSLLLGEAAAGAIRGTGQGLEAIVAESTEALLSSFNTPKSWIGIGFIALGLLLLFKRIRYYLMRPVRWLNTTPDERRNDR
ncbi:hypothetical protein ABC977_02000 [Thioalkalicoccus limnaeus]|uniref:Uncharacterized protein n=1 Tax=Thioalkalicoccus limnaeus TaxID=120681 RepID=A0ABV4BAU3_9GAMM